jgi:hypothetical protein
MHKTIGLVIGFVAFSQIAAAAPLFPAHTRLMSILPDPSAPSQLAFRVPFSKPSHSELVATQQDDLAVIKFTEGTGIRLRGSGLVVLDSALELDRAARLGVTRSKLDMQLALLTDILNTSGASITRTLTKLEDDLAAERHSGEERTKRELPDLNLFYGLQFPGKTASDVVNLLDTMNQLDIVEYAGPTVKAAPPPMDLDPPTPNFSSQQTYFAAAPSGIDVGFARLLPGGRGESLRIVDVEQGWIPDHEDFPSLVSSSGNNYAPQVNHGTAVIGEMAAVENGYGMTGIAPSVEISVSSPVVGVNNAFNVADGVQRAYDQSRSGDIILVEQQVYYDYPSDQALCPPEWDLNTFSVAQNAVANGRIVIETAGNGAQNLDDSARFGTRFNRNTQDTGAIYVGAGYYDTHAPRSDTNYGTRLDVQGWGNNIATLGYGDLFFPNGDSRQTYTTVFAGTSGAAPMVTGAAAILQAIRRARMLPDLTSQQMRPALVIGATPQGAGVMIGPLPNLRSAIAAIPIPPPVISATGSATGSATITWSAVPAISGYKVFRRDSQTSGWNLLNTTSMTLYTDNGLPANRTFLYRVRAFDAAGDESADSNDELATTISYTDNPLTTSTVIRARHIVEVRSAVNAICAYAGTAICPIPPFSGAALDETQMKTQVIRASDFDAVQNQIISLRAAIGASAATFRETPAVGMSVRIIHMEDLRTGAN